MAIAGAVFMMLVALTVLLIARAELATERTEKAHAVVDAVWSMADSFKHTAESGAITEDEAKARFFAASSAVWFEGHTNYLFICDTDTVNLRGEELTRISGPSTTIPRMGYRPEGR